MKTFTELEHALETPKPKDQPTARLNNDGTAAIMFDKGSPKIGEILKKLQHEGFSAHTKDSGMTSYIIIEKLSDTKQSYPNYQS